MRTASRPWWWLSMWLAATSALAQDDLSVSPPLPLPPAGRLADGNGEFVLDVVVDPLAGQRLEAGEFVIELRQPSAPSDSLFADRFE